MRHLIFGLIFILFSLACSSPREVKMPFYNYYIPPSRLIPIQFSDSKLCIRIWVSQSTSLDRVIIINKEIDSTYSGTLITYGFRIRRKKPIYEYYFENTEPVSGNSKFIEEIMSLKIDSLKNQEASDLVLHQPYKFCLVEIFNNGNYHSFNFQLDANKDVEKFENLRVFLANEFPKINFQK